MAHELSHVRNYDIRFSLMVGVLVGSIALLADFFLRFTFWGGGRRRGRDRERRRWRAGDRVRHRDRPGDPRADHRAARPARGQPPARVPGRCRRRVELTRNPVGPGAGAGEDRGRPGGRSRSPTAPPSTCTSRTRSRSTSSARRTCSRRTRRSWTGSTGSARCSRAGARDLARRSHPRTRARSPAPRGAAWSTASGVGEVAVGPVEARSRARGILRAAEGLFGPEQRAEIAQLVEHATENRGVASSNLALGTNRISVFERKWLSW